MWNKIKLAWQTAYESVKKPWKECWESFKTAVINFVCSLGLFVWGIVQLVFQVLLAFIKSAGIIVYDSLANFIKRW